ncbi:hypothetical protein MPSI1_003181 [Malassezia psittaci]|uniref:Cytochrome c oxidase assembly factor 3 n=1 Tax=Malassezia psittaci TaxID=1821823 RepID=A0AAF0FH82_9BASI|nr:hypothetical protein MPSI1_003181 [Malassezia psittaci]
MQPISIRQVASRATSLRLAPASAGVQSITPVCASVRKAAIIHTRFAHLGAFRATYPRHEELMREINQAQKTYHPRGFGNSTGYKRARKPYFVGNMLTFLALCAFVGSVYAYSIVSVEQDDFSDIESIRVLPEDLEAPTEQNKVQIVPTGPESGAHPPTTLKPPSPAGSISDPPTTSYNEPSRILGVAPEMNHKAI